MRDGPEPAVVRPFIPVACADLVHRKRDDRQPQDGVEVVLRRARPRGLRLDKVDERADGALYEVQREEGDTGFLCASLCLAHGAPGR